MDEVDKTRTKRNARSVLNEYRSLARQNNVDTATKVGQMSIK